MHRWIVTPLLLWVSISVCAKCVWCQTEIKIVRQKFWIENIGCQTTVRVSSNCVRHFSHTLLFMPWEKVPGVLLYLLQYKNRCIMFYYFFSKFCWVFFYFNVFYSSWHQSACTCDSVQTKAFTHRNMTPKSVLPTASLCSMCVQIFYLTETISMTGIGCHAPVLFTPPKKTLATHQKLCMRMNDSFTQTRPHHPWANLSHVGNLLM